MKQVDTLLKIVVSSSSAVSKKLDEFTHGIVGFMLGTSMASKLTQITLGILGFQLGTTKAVLRQVNTALPYVWWRLQYTPYSNKIHFGISQPNKLTNVMYDIHWNLHINKHKAQIIDPTMNDKYANLVPAFIKIVQALSDGLRFQHDCTISIRLPDYNKSGSGYRTESIVPARFKHERDEQISRFGLKYNTEHLDGLNWELCLLDSDEDNAYQFAIGKIVVLSKHLHNLCSEEEVACTLAHEVAHGVAQHRTSYASFLPLWLRDIPMPILHLGHHAISGFTDWLLLTSLHLYTSRRRECEADYIGLLLMASAGYDPQCAPRIWRRKIKESDIFDWGSTHPSNEERANMLSGTQLMDKAIKIYEEVQAGQGVRSFVSKGTQDNF